jgi:hypothetical protein
MRKCPAQSTHSPKPRDDKEMNLRVGDLLPGQRVSVDHFKSSQPGRMYSTKGSSKSVTYCVGAIFVDHATGFISVQHQQTFGAADTIKAKLQFERAAYDDGVIIQDYHTDNGVSQLGSFSMNLSQKDNGFGSPVPALPTKMESLKEAFSLSPVWQGPFFSKPPCAMVAPTFTRTYDHKQ